jgi:hypothetical protein
LNRRRIRRKRQELKRIRSEIFAAKEEAERTKYRRRKKRKQQELFRLERKLRAAREHAEDNPDGRPAPRVASKSEIGGLPDFVIIGGKKYGTSTLYHLLTRHPHVEPAATKELHYFDGLLFDEGTEWYRRCFPPPRWAERLLRAAQSEALRIYRCGFWVVE